jgi:glycosyltransferase involved in cell wall biosynthesis
LNIAINTRLLLKDKLEGIGWFTYEIVSRMVKTHPEHHFFFIFDRPFHPDFIFGANVTPIVLSPQARHPILYKVWFDFRIPSLLKKHKIDVFLSPDGFLSTRTNVPQIPVIHDLNFEHYPEDLPNKDRKYYKKYMPLFAKKAAHIITVSEFSKSDIHKQYGISLDKISVVYNAVNSDFAPIDEDKKQLVRQKFSEGAPFFVYLGALHKRKNIERMLLAFDLFKTTQPSSMKMVIVGAKLFKEDLIEKVYNKLNHKADVVFTGRLPKSELIKVVAAAEAMVYVSYFEGFGIPIIEAMKCGVPVITSNVTSMPEVAGDAGLLVDPFSVEDIARGMKQMASTIDKTEWIEKGKIRAQFFSWDASAQAVWNSIERIAEKTKIQP